MVQLQKFGLIYGKTALECTLSEVIDEIWAQMTRCPQLNLPMNHKDLVIKWTNIWGLGDNDKIGQYILETEPKFSNNVGTLRLRPSFRIFEDKNIYISTAYIKETLDIFSMEGAVIAGKQVAHSINSISQPPFMIKRPIMFTPFRAFDKIVFTCGMPNLWIIFVILLLIIIYYLYSSSVSTLAYY